MWRERKWVGGRRKGGGGEAEAEAAGERDANMPIRVGGSGGGMREASALPLAPVPHLALGAVRLDEAGFQGFRV